MVERLGRVQSPLLGIDSARVPVRLGWQAAGDSGSSNSKLGSWRK
jgi:hypothetical protein